MQPTPAEAAARRIPMWIPLVSDRVSAGFPSPAGDYVETALDLNEHLVRHPATTFFVRAQGHSMSGAGIQSGDLLVVDRALTGRHGAIVVAVLDGEFVVKRLEVTSGGRRMRLLAESPDYTPIEITPEREFLLWGVVTFVIHEAR